MYVIKCIHYEYGQDLPIKQYLREQTSPRVQFFADKASAQAEADELNSDPMYLDLSKYSVQYEIQYVRPERVKRMKARGF